jgi:hypothetical protein
MLGKYFLWGAIGAVVIVLGMLFYPTVHTNWDGIDVTGFIPLVQSGMVILSYGFIPLIVYLIYAHIKK